MENGRNLYFYNTKEESLSSAQKDVDKNSEKVLGEFELDESEIEKLIKTGINFSSAESDFEKTIQSLREKFG